MHRYPPSWNSPNAKTNLKSETQISVPIGSNHQQSEYHAKANLPLRKGSTATWFQPIDEGRSKEGLPRGTLRCESLESRMLLSVYYVDAINGKDTYTGLAGTYTSGTTGPWQTLAKVNSKTFKAGDQVLFQRGDVWRGQLVTRSGSSSGRITYGAYGDPSLAKPLFLGSAEEDSTSNVDQRRN